METKISLFQQLCVRVPVFFGHSEAIQIETSDYIDEKQGTLAFWRRRRVLQLSTSAGMEVILQQSMSQLVATPYLSGVIRKDISLKNGLNLWVVSDNVRERSCPEFYTNC